MARRDLLRECNDRKVPLEDFQLAFCQRCIQPDCTRSVEGNSIFEKRVKSWRERLFQNIPRMKEDDPRYNAIHLKTFPTYEVPSKTSVQVPSSWLDPRELSNQEAPKAATQPAPEPQAETVSAEVPVVEKPVVAAPKPAGPVPFNTPAQSGRMLGGAPPPEPKADSWAAPEPKSNAAPGEKIVRKGATVRLGGGRGVE